MQKQYSWNFPLPRTHTGMLQGNGTLGAMIWGEGGVLRITLGLADYWDHRGGLEWTEEMSFANIRACLEGGDDAGLRRMFAPPPRPEGTPAWPSVLPIGRLELDFGAEACLTTGILELSTGLCTVEVEQGGGRYAVRIVLDMERPVMAVACDDGLTIREMRRVPAWEYVGEYLKSISFPPPEFFASAELTGWVQPTPEEWPLTVGYRQEGNTVFLTAMQDMEPQVFARDLVSLTMLHGGFNDIHERNTAWWQDYWAEAASLTIPNERLQFLYDYGMYKFAGLTNPAGVPATLQGPWIEEYQMPPWSSDYHFNINVQMCYWPAYHGNRLEHLKPLFEMIAGWTETLRHNARVFAHIEDGQMLPHAVDNHGTCIGGFWSGSLDHGCTAWVAQMMYRYYRYTMDTAFLRETAYPFMIGALRVYEAMLERDGDRFVLPISVSPEYHTKATHSPWGRNASFQLACIHRLCEDVLAAATVLGEAPRPSWREIAEKTPCACLIGKPGEERIAIWEGTPLEESHRHHSHLAGITPFDILNLEDETWSRIIGRSLDEWIYHGPGLWSGWCVPWAAMIHMRFGKGEAAELLLESWQRVFTNEGHGTLHDANIPGFTLFGQGYANPHTFAGRKEVMQMDAGMSCTAAIQEMLLHTRQGVNYLFAGAPARWQSVAFTNMRTDGAFLVSATRARGTVTEITITSPAGGVFRLANPWPTARLQRADGRVETCTGTVLEIATQPGERVTLTAQ